MRALFIALAGVAAAGVAASGNAASGAAREGPKMPHVSWQPEAPRQGDPLLLELRAGGSVQRVRGRFLGRRVEFFRWGPGRWRALAPIPAGTRPDRHRLRLTLWDASGRRRTLTRSIGVAEADFPTSELSVDPKFTRPPAAVRPRIRRERRRIRRAWQDTGPTRWWRAPFLRPLKSPRTSVFGVRRLFNGKLRSRHNGVDLDGKIGDPIRATNHGRVVLAGDLYYTGRCVFIDHGYGLFSVYFHMTDLRVKEGEVVHKGQIIGTVGESGRVTGPHLHFGIKLLGAYVDPERLLALDFGPEVAPDPVAAAAPGNGVPAAGGGAPPQASEAVGGSASE
ncbi:MAG: M23 family metallopeptidase [Deltaproteobacteria bacterium]|nr:MAG: M23 family metallopeptidase [Deltaproteobacteria bacterium]